MVSCNLLNRFIDAIGGEFYVRSRSYLAIEHLLKLNSGFLDIRIGINWRCSHAKHSRPL